jgi:hypothetical protein
MRKGTVAVLFTVTLVALLAVGCASMGGKKDLKSIDQTLAGWKAALEKQDIEGMMPAYSDDFKTDQGDGKEKMKAFLAGAKEKGYLEGVKADLSKAEKKIDKGVATVGPIDLSSDMGSMSIELTLKKSSDKVWRIVGSGEAS